MNSKIKINLATKDELMTLSKVGEKMAERILLYRENVGYFDTIEDLKQVKGVGDTLINLNKDKLDFELSIQERMERMKSEIMERYVNPLTGVFIKGEQSGDRHAARQAMNKLKEDYLQEHSEGWELVVEWATTEFKAHKEEESMDVLDENLMPISDEELLEEAEKSALLWLKVKGGGSSSLDKDSQQYVEMLEELLYLEHKLDTELVGRSPEENDNLVLKMETLEDQLLGLSIKIKENFTGDDQEGSLDHFLKIIERGDFSESSASRYLRRLRLNTEMSVEKDLRDEMAYLDDDRTAGSDNLEAYNEYEEAKWDIMLTKAPQLRWLNKPAKGWTEGGFTKDEVTTRIQDNNWHNRYMREEAEKVMEAILNKRKKEHGVAVHGQYLEEGEMKMFLFPETEELLNKYRAKLKKMANELDEQTYYTKLGEERKVMLRLFSESQKKGQVRFRAEFIKNLKKDLNELRNLFFMPYGREELKKAQDEHIKSGKAMKWLPTMCKKDLQLGFMEFRNRNGVLVRKKVNNPLAFLNKESLITLYNDGVARLLAMGVSETELSNFRGSVFLKTYEQHMADQGKSREAAAMVKARQERDEKAEERKLRTQLNAATGGAQVVKGDQGVASVFDDNDEEIYLDYVGEMPSPEELVLINEIMSDDF